MVGSLPRQTQNLLEVSFHLLRTPDPDQADIQDIFSLMRQYTLLLTYHANGLDPQPEFSSEKEGVMNELPNLTIHPICPREKLLMLSRLGKSQL
jgi:hypothetical protein